MSGLLTSHNRKTFKARWILHQTRRAQVQTAYGAERGTLGKRPKGELSVNIRSVFIVVFMFLSLIFNVVALIFNVVGRLWLITELLTCVVLFWHLRGIEWLFGIEPADDDDKDDNVRLKWEARQRRLHKLRTDKQPIPRSPTATATVAIQPEGVASRCSST